MTLLNWIAEHWLLTVVLMLIAWVMVLSIMHDLRFMVSEWIQLWRRRP